MAHTLAISQQEKPQAVRLHRHFMATSTSFLVIGLLFICHLQGFLDLRDFFEISAVVLFLVIVFYLMLRTGFNRKFADGSLTLPQMSTSSITILYAMYAANGARAAFIVILLMIFLFGILRFGRRVLLLFAVFILSGHLAVIGLLVHFKPKTIDISLEITLWIVMALSLPWFAIMGGYVSELRARLRQSNNELRSALETVQASEADLAEAEHIARLGGWRYDIDGKSVWSSETYRIFGLDPSLPAPKGDQFWQLIYEEDRSRYRQVIKEALQKCQGFESEFRMCLPNGEIRWVQAIGNPETGKDAKSITLRGTVMDITERKRADEALKNSEARFRSLTALSSDWYWEQNDALCFTEIAGSADEVARIETKNLIGKPWLEVVCNCVPLEAWDVHKELINARKPFANFVYTCTDVEQNARYLRASGEPIFDEAGQFTGYRGVTKDITAQHLAEERIRQLAHYDELTGLQTRAIFYELLNDRIYKARRQESRLAVLFIDLDGFKQINDTLGHGAGDQLLKTFAQRLREVLRRSDAVARFAGDEFVVLVDDFTVAEQVAVVAGKILAVALQPFLIAGTSCNVSASIGIAIYPLDGSETEALIKSADSAMYRAKEAGKSRYHFFSDPSN